MRRTKIICTLGPAVDDPMKLKELIQSGMNCARLNFSHGDHAEQLERIRLVKKNPGGVGCAGCAAFGYQRSGNPAAGF